MHPIEMCGQTLFGTAAESANITAPAASQESEESLLADADGASYEQQQVSAAEGGAEHIDVVPNTEGLHMEGEESDEVGDRGEDSEAGGGGGDASGSGDAGDGGQDG